MSCTMITLMIPLSFIVSYHVSTVNNEIVMNNECAHIMLRDIHHCSVMHMYSHLTQHDEQCLTMIMSVDDDTIQL